MDTLMAPENHPQDYEALSRLAAQGANEYAAALERARELAAIGAKAPLGTGSGGHGAASVDAGSGNDGAGSPRNGGGGGAGHGGGKGPGGAQAATAGWQAELTQRLQVQGCCRGRDYVLRSSAGRCAGVNTILPRNRVLPELPCPPITSASSCSPPPSTKGCPAHFPPHPAPSAPSIPPRPLCTSRPILLANPELPRPPARQPQRQRNRHPRRSRLAPTHRRRRGRGRRRRRPGRRRACPFRDQVGRACRAARAGARRRKPGYRAATDNRSDVGKPSAAPARDAPTPSTAPPRRPGRRPPPPSADLQRLLVALTQLQRVDEQPLFQALAKVGPPEAWSHCTRGTPLSRPSLRSWQLL
jgi:hypothetical protein